MATPDSCFHRLARTLIARCVGSLCLFSIIIVFADQSFAFQISRLSEPTETIQRQILNQTIFKNRDQRIWLGRAEQQVEAGNTAAALALLHAVLEFESDSAALGGESGTTLVSIRAEAMRLISSLPLETLRTYQRVYGDAAQRLLDDAHEKEDAALFARVIRQYFHTEAGFQAADWLASRWLDRGHYSLAASMWARLLSERTHRHRIHPRIVLKAAIAYQFSGDHGKAAKTLRGFDLSTIKVGGRRIRTATILAELANFRATGRDDSEWVQAQGNARRNGSSIGGVPFLMPKWSISLAGEGHQFGPVAKREMSNSNNSELPNAVANYPIIVGDQVIFRDFFGIRSIELNTGKPVWKYPNELALEGLLAAFGVAKKPGPAFSNAFVGNTATGMLASDGHLVFSIEFLDSVEKEDAASPKLKTRALKIRRKPRRRIPPIQHVQIDNRLVAVSIPVSKQGAERILKPIWSVGGPAKRTGSDDRLAGHYFLGAPLYANGMLYVITEFDRQVNLAAIEPATGRAIWVQGIALVPNSIRRGDQMPRFAATCAPASADGIIVCPTGCGILVGVDGLDGTLMWAYDYRDYNDRRFRAMATRNAQLAMRSRGHVGFASLPMIERDFVVFLPRHSARLHCIRLKTGHREWTQPCPDAEYVGAIVDDTVIVVGNSKVRGLSLTTQKQLWDEYTGPPSGRGLRIGRKYLLPLRSKPVACLDIETGKRCNVELRDSTTSRWSDVVSTGKPEFDLIRPVTALPNHGLRQFYLQPGNLVANADVIVSAGPQFVTAFPQAQFLLNELKSPQFAESRSDDLQILVAELQLTTGDLTSAETQLETLGGRQLTKRQSADARALMLELQFSKFDSQIGGQQEVLAAIDRLSKTRHERGRFLIRKSEWQLDQGDFEGLLTSTQESRSLDLHAEMSAADNPRHSIAAASWVPDIIGRIQTQFGPDQVEQVAARVDTEQAIAVQSNEIAQLTSFLAVYSEWPQAGDVRVALARRYIENREFQKAELLLLQNRNSSNIQTAGIATAELARMWDRLGLHGEAAALLQELDSRFAETTVAENQLGRQFVASFDEQSPTSRMFRGRHAPAWCVTRVSISEHRWLENDPYLLDAYGSYRRRFATPKGSSFHLLDKGSTRESKIAVIRKDAGTIVGNIIVPVRHSYPLWAPFSLVGHLIPMGSPATMHGVSLLENDDQKPFWEQEFPQVKFSKEFLRVGPAGPTFCTFQTRQHLVAVNPADGRLLWRRSDVERGSGLVSDQLNGLFGDENILVLFAKDRQNYTIYQTLTGKILRHGRLDVDPQYQRQVFGRKFFYVTQSAIDRRMRVWDPLHNRFELDEPMSARLFKTVTPDGELAIVVGNDRLRILDVATGESKLNLKLTDRQIASLSYLRIFSDNDRYYLNLQRPLPVRRRRIYSYHVTDTFLPATDIQGEIHAIDRQTGKLLWDRTFPQRTFLDLSEYRLPFLIAMSRVRDSNFGNRQSMLVEVIDARTGQPISMKENILPDRIVNIDYDPQAGRIDLFGLKSRISLDFSRKIQQLHNDVPPTL